MSLARLPQRQNLPAPTALTPALRHRIEDAVEALLAVLDAADPDPDIEDSHDAEAIDEREPDDDGDMLD